MKRCLILLVVLASGAVLHAAGIPTNEVSYSVLKVAPEKYRSKLIAFSEVYHRFQTTLPMFAENSGFKPARWLLLEIGDPSLPVLIKKRNDITELIAGLKAGTAVKVVGRVREFKFDPRWPMAPKHYLEAENLYLQKAQPPVNPPEKAGGAQPPPPEAPGNVLAPPPF